MFSVFMSEETGAVTVDWVTLSAGVLLLGIAVVYAIFVYGVDLYVSDINGELNKASGGICHSLEAAEDNKGLICSFLD